MNLYDNPLIKSVRLQDVRAYLLAHGWQFKALSRSQLLRFDGPNDDAGEPIVQVIPASDQASDFRPRVAELVGALSAIEQRDPEVVLRNILRSGFDSVRVRVDATDTRAGTLPLSFAPKFAGSARDLMVFSACTEISPRSYYPRAMKQALEFAEKCRIAPGPPGSFVVFIEAPIAPPINADQLARGTAPIERRVINRLAIALAAVTNLVRTGTVSSQQATPVVSANFCDAILGMKPRGDVTLDLEISRSPAWPEPNSESARFRYETGAFDTIESFARALRSTYAPERRRFVGRIIKLSGDDPVGGMEGELIATMRVDPPSSLRHVHLSLDPTMYRLACDAHRDGRVMEAEGILDRVGKRWQLLEISAFQPET